jgi:hypothetical protein
VKDWQLVAVTYRYDTGRAGPAEQGEVQAVHCSRLAGFVDNNAVHGAEQALQTVVMQCWTPTAAAHSDEHEPRPLVG